MSFSEKVAPTRKLASLNPNAVEFVPFALRSSSESRSSVDAATSLNFSGTLGKSVPDHPESSISNNSDEESHQYWCRQLPDDITPDFKVMEEDNSQRINSIPFSTLSLHDGNQTSRVSASTGSGFLFKERRDLSPHGSNCNIFSDKMRFPAPSYSEDAIRGDFLHTTKPWEKQMTNNDQFTSLVRDGSSYNGNFTQDLLNEQALSDSTGMNPLEFLALQFPGFASESLTEVYLANGGDLNLTAEMLTQLELQVDIGLNQNLNSKALSAPNLTAIDFPALSVQDGQNRLPKNGGDDTQQSASSYLPTSKDNLHMFKSSSTLPTRGAVDFATALRKIPPSDGSIWKYERKGPAATSVVSSRSSHMLASSYNGGQGRCIDSDRIHNRTSSRAAPVWLDTGEAVASMYSEMREEARDHARLRNAYLEQARQAYIIGNKALAKELSVKGQLHNLHMKAAHGKAQESIYRHRNPVDPELQSSNGRGQERMIDLHGLHVIEAINVLKRELAVLRSVARSSGQRLKVYICVGTGHHTRGSRTPARLPIAIQKYLLEEEGLDYAEPQPGLLRVLVY